MPEPKNNGIYFLNVKKLLIFALSLEDKSVITVQEFMFHYAINSCAYLKKQLTLIRQGN